MTLSLQTLLGVEGPRAHLAFLGLFGTAAGVLALATLACLMLRRDGGVITRSVALLVVALSASATLLAHEIALSNVARIVPGPWPTVFITVAAWWLAAKLASARTGLVVASVHAMACFGAIIFLVLIRSVPTGDDATWEVDRFADMGLYQIAGFLGLLAMGFVSSRSRGRLTTLGFVLVGLSGLVALTLTMRADPKPSGVTVPLLLFALALVTWLVVALRQRDDAPRGRWLARLQHHPAIGVLIVALPFAAGSLAVLVGAGGTAREVSRVTLLGVDLTPGLVVPFVYALAIGYLAGRESRWRVPAVLAVTGAIGVLLLAQKEVGNVAVIAMTMAAVLLVARGTLLHTIGGAVLATLGVALAYQLAPVTDLVPYTFHERIQLWLGGAEIMHRGGSLVAASHITFDLGGFWGIGIHRAPGLDLQRLMVALDTDFPLTLLGLSGGMVLLGAFVAVFTSMSILLLDSVRRLDFVRDMRRARAQTPLLAALWAVPVVSTTLNLAGAVTQASPFTGVPVAFVSYSSTFTLGCYALVGYFLLAANRAAVRATSKALGEADRVVAQPGRGALPIEAMAPSLTAPVDVVLPPRPRWTFANLFDRYRWALWRHRLGRHARFRRVDGGLWVLVLVSLAVAAGFGRILYVRYTDDATYFAHPRLEMPLRIETTQETDGPLRWRVVEGSAEAVRGELSDGQRLRHESLSMRFDGGELAVLGGCFSEARLRTGVRIGFAGELDAPRLPWLDNRTEWLLTSLAGAPQRNDIVAPLGNIGLQHALVQMTDAGTFRVTPLRPEHVVDGQGASVVEPGPDADVVAAEPGAAEPPEPGQPIARRDEAGSLRASSVPSSARNPIDVTLGGHFALGASDPLRFTLRRDSADDAICIELEHGALYRYALSMVGPTVIGGPELRRGHSGAATVDLEFSMRFKEAAEAGVVKSVGPSGPLQVIAWDAEARRHWSKETRRLFYGIFDIRSLRTEDGGTVEGLYWSRPFYHDASRAFDGRRELDAFVLDGERVVGLSDTSRFRRTLPTGREPLDLMRHGQLYDRRGRLLTKLDPASQRIRGTLVGAEPLLGYGFEARATRDGLIRVFAPLLEGVPPKPDVADELRELLAGEWLAAWGWDVQTTLDAEIQQLVVDVLRDETAQLARKAPFDAHHASVVVLGPGNELIAVAQVPEAEAPQRYVDAVWLKDLQRTAPMKAPALDAYTRRTTLGSAIKVLGLIAAFRHPENVFVPDEKGRLYFDATGDPSYGSKGRFADRGGVLSSWKGRPITSIRNYQGETYSGAVSVFEMLVHSVNTAAAYMALNLGRDNFLETIAALGLDQSQDLLPPELGHDGPFGHLVERYPNDPATMMPAAVAVIPDNERWTLSYTARLPLSGTSDYSALNLAVGVSVVARDGLLETPRIVRGLRDRHTGELQVFDPPPPKAIIEPEAAQLITEAMQEVIHRGTGKSFRKGTTPEIWQETAGKTGTGETVVPVDPKAVYRRTQKPATRDNKVFVSFWPTSSPDPYVVAVVFEQVSHLDKTVAVRTNRRIVEGIAAIEARRAGPLAAPRNQGWDEPTSTVHSDDVTTAVVTAARNREGALR
ncbi:MAG: hypothetical protein AUK47_16770 [Deltaproteobacteria bacterium CG2_30_63_29]|nr:MAG: hypothetical protein AUK47_16770 [Deltaproteobacteria bacterium CG2_30_63_29]PJB40092.1 MAG: hypothetical protein CO108_15650 [Deltaproteobacteria bacterium CG_4_9_14_3_um_filter_63_12]